MLKEIKLESVQKHGCRFYTTPDGNEYPSVTSVTRLHSMDAIKKWRERVGEEEANRISLEASTKGTAFHSLMEKTLLESVQTDPTIIKGFEKVYPKICSEIVPHISDIQCIEYALYSDALRVAGRVDLVARYYGKLAICDWKTTKKFKGMKYTEGYWMQTAAYAVMMKEIYNVDIEKLVLFFNYNDEKTYVLTQDVDKWVEEFAKLRAKYEETYGI